MKQLLYILAVSFTLFVSAQDARFSNYTYAPFTINPGYSGHFNGKYRVQLNTRNQWRTVSEPYRTNSVHFDASNIAQKNIGIDFGVLSDKTGSLEYGFTQFQLGSAIQLDVTDDIMISPGIQISRSQLGYNLANILIRDQGDVLNTDPQNLFMINAGIVSSYYFNNNAILNVGIGVYNLNKPNVSFIGNNTSRLPRRFNIHADFYFRKNTWLLMPRTLLALQGNAYEWVIGTEIKKEVHARMIKTNVEGLFFAVDKRWKDSYFYTMGMETPKFRIGLAQDINNSALRPASRGRGGMELYIRYIFKPKAELGDPHRGCKLFL